MSKCTAAIGHNNDYYHLITGNHVVELLLHSELLTVIAKVLENASSS